MTTRRTYHQWPSFLFFFSAVIVVQSGRQIEETIKMCLLKQTIIFSKKATGTFFHMVIKNNPAKFRFLTLLPSGRKSLKPKCSGSCRNQLVRVYMFFSHPIYYPRPSLRSLLVVTQIRGHITGSSPLPATRIKSLPLGNSRRVETKHVTG